MPHEHDSKSHPKPGNERPLWVLSADEKRMLLITFVGGLASIVIGAAMIGSAIAYARWPAANSILVPTLAGAAVALFLYSLIIRRSRFPSWLKWGMTIMAALLLGTALLSFVGIAAGIH